jgi:hypothetical protein
MNATPNRRGDIHHGDMAVLISSPAVSPLVLAENNAKPTARAMTDAPEITRGNFPFLFLFLVTPEIKSPTVKITPTGRLSMKTRMN